MVAEDNQSESTPLASKLASSPGEKAASRADSSGSPPVKPSEDKDLLLSPEEIVKDSASKAAAESFHSRDPKVWAVLTAVNDNARQRKQGLNMVLNVNVHFIGRLVEDYLFRIDSKVVSGEHCKIYRQALSSGDDAKSQPVVFLKDNSSNGTYVNWKRLTKKNDAVKIHHGDIISFAGPPHTDIAFAFVYREVVKSASSANGVVTKRKAEELASESKRVKGIGLGAPEGPISLDDFRSLQRSNTELRKQLEDQVVTIDKLQNENRASVVHHQTEMKNLKESITKLYLNQIKELQDMLDAKHKELVEASKLSAEQKHTIDDLNGRLASSLQSYTEANEIMSSQKSSIAELKVQLEEEKDQRREEREKAAVDKKEALERAHSEAQADIKRLSDATLRREIEHKEVIQKLQEQEKERCSYLETMRSKLEDTRQNLVGTENKIRQLETQICEEQQVSAEGKKKAEELQLELQLLRKELASEKAAREEAWAKVSALEVEISGAIRDLDYEKRRLKAARERLMLRETQLRAFYSTTEKINVLFVEQQEQLKAMQKTLEDEDNYENVSTDIDLNVPYGAMIRNIGGADERETNQPSESTAKATSAISAQRFNHNQTITSSDDSVTEGHECDARSDQVVENTQEVEFTSADPNLKGGFGSDIDALVATSVPEGSPIGSHIEENPTDTEPQGDHLIGTEQGDAIGAERIGTERVMETQSVGIDTEQNTGCGDTMQLDEVIKDSEERGGREESTKIPAEESPKHDAQDTEVEEEEEEEEEDGGTIRTADLLASEAVGSWACSTAPSVQGENDLSARQHPNNEDGEASVLLTSHVSESQSGQSLCASNQHRERRALTEMIAIVAPDLKGKFCGVMEGRSSEGSDSETDDNDGNGKSKGQSSSDSETQDSNGRDEEKAGDDPMDEDDEDTPPDSVG